MTRARLRPGAPAAPVLAAAVATLAGGCGLIAGSAQGVADRPSNVKALPPIVLVAEASSPGGEYRAWVYNTSDAMTCLEVAQASGGGSGCGPLGVDPGAGRSEDDSGILVSGSTTEASAVRAIVHDANGPDVTVAATSAEPVLPGVRVFVAGFAKTANPFAVDFVDEAGTVVDRVDLP
jgi:hypothetical protein